MSKTSRLLLILAGLVPAGIARASSVIRPSTALATATAFAPGASWTAALADTLPFWAGAVVRCGCAVAMTVKLRSSF